MIAINLKKQTTPDICPEWSVLLMHHGSAYLFSDMASITSGFQQDMITRELARLIR